MRRRRVSRAFILADCLAALFIFALILPAALSLWRTASFELRLCRDRAVAQRRAECVAAILVAPVFYCGMGMAAGAEGYKRGFNNRLATPFSWNGPLSILPTYDKRPEGLLRVAFGFPESARLKNEARGVESKAELTFDAPPVLNYLDLSLFDKGSSVKNWLLFAGCRKRTPFCALAANGAKLTVKNYAAKDFYLPKGDRIVNFRALEVFSRDGKLYTNDFRTAGEQPRENGVCDIRFRVRDDMRALTVYILIRGDDASLANGAAAVRRVENWPPEYRVAYNEYPYPLYSFQYSWPLLNLARAAGEK
ncbi:MAG: hypothetical protein RR340_01965 [Cloacibacillus sp.]